MSKWQEMAETYNTKVIIFVQHSLHHENLRPPQSCVRRKEELCAMKPLYHAISKKGERKRMEQGKSDYGKVCWERERRRSIVV